MTDHADVIRQARELVQRRGRTDRGGGDYSVDPGWHQAARLLPALHALDARVKELEAALRELSAAASEALVIVRGGTAQMPNEHWKRIVVAGIAVRATLGGGS